MGNIPDRGGGGTKRGARPITSRKRSMGRTRTRSKNQRHISTKTTTTESSSSSSTTTPSVPALISKAQSIIEQCDYDLANQFIQRILQISPKNVEAKEMLGVVQLELGQVQEARKVSPKPFASVSLLSWYVWCYTDLRILGTTTPGCSIFTHPHAVLTPSSVER